jgi:hypothetical protein
VLSHHGIGHVASRDTFCYHPLGARDFSVPVRATAVIHSTHAESREVPAMGHPALCQLGLTATTAAALAGLTATTSAVASADNEDIAFVMGGTGPCCVTSLTPPALPGPPYTTIEADQLFIAPYFPGYTAEGLPTPEQFAPFTGLTSEPLSTSVAQGVTDLNTAVTEQLDQGNHVVVFGYSQSATVATVYEEYLATLPPDARPSPSQLSFVLIGDPDNPDGGLFERIAGVYVPALGAEGYGATPDDLYPSVIYTLQYDGFADFPQYPLDIPADLNADLGIFLVHPTYPDLTPEQVATGVVEPVTPADTDTTYILIPTQNLPLLDLLQGVVPAPLLDLIEPPLRDIINLGYDPTAPANVPAPATLFPLDNPITVVVDFLRSIGQGVNDALAAEGLPSLPSLPDVPIVSNLVNSLTATSTFTLPTVTLDVPPQIGEVIDGPLNNLDSLITNAINDELDPAIQSTAYGIGAALTAVATDVDAPAAITNAIYVGEQLSPFELEIPGLFVTNVTQDLATAVEDLAIGDISGFGQELQTIGADSIIMDNFAAAFAIEALQAIATGVPLGI